MAQQVYSFNDVYAAIGFSGVPLIIINGQGVGEIGIDRANDNTVQEVAADGVVMTSKIKAANGTVHISCLQTSTLHSLLKKAFDLLTLAATTTWATGSITISSPSGLIEFVNATGVAFTKPASLPYGKQGQMVTWTFMCADIQYL